MAGAPEADIKLLFGVAGGGSLSGESGKLIQGQLTQLMTELNKNPLKVKIGLDTDTGGKKSWGAQLQEKLDQISQDDKFSVQISNLKLNEGAISDFRKQLGAIVNTLGLSSGAEIKVSPKGIDETARQVERVGGAASNAAKKAAELAAAATSVSENLSNASRQTSKSREEIVAYSTQLNVLKTVLSSVESLYKSASFGNSMLTNSANIEKVTESVNNLKLHIEEAGKISIGDISALERENALIKQEAQELVGLVSALRQVESAEQAVNSNSPMSTERIAQLASLKAAMDSVNATFKSAVFGKDMVTDAASVQEITQKFVECTTKAKEALATSAEDDATLRSRVSLLQENARELQELVSLKRQLETPGADFEVQLRTLKAAISSIDSLFNSAVAGKSKFENPEYMAEVSAEYEKFKKIATEALNASQTGDTNALKENVALVQRAADEFQSLISLVRQLEMPGTDYAAKLREVQVIIRAIKSEFDSIISGRKGIVGEEEIQTAETLYRQVEEIERRIKSVTDASGLQNEIPALNSIRSQIKDLDETIKQAKARLDALTAQKSAIGETLGDLSATSTVSEEQAKIEEISASYAQWAKKIEEVRTAKAANPTAQLDDIEAEGKAILSNIERLNEERAARESAAKAAADAANTTAEADKKRALYQEQKAASLRAGLKLLIQMEQAERNWTAAQSGSSKKNYKGITDGIAELKRYKQQLDSDEKSVEEFRNKLAELQKSFADNSDAIKLAGENTKSLGDRMGGLAQKFSAWFSVSQAVMLGVRSIRQMVSATIELDDAMTQLRVVTRTTEDAYNSYMESISKTATRIGSSVTDLISSTTTYARLGYSLDESSALAEFTAMLQNVGDIDVADAQDALTAIVKAFGISVDEIESVMDKLVITGNNFPISVSQIAEGMNNASSALAAAGNTFDQSVALLTAANTTIQNAAKSSTGLRTIAARLRSTKTELDELGETMTEAEYGDLVAALTKYNVALTDANGEFRSTYDIVSDIAAVWEDLTPTEQAALANAIAGVRQQSVFFSLVEQFQEASGAMEDMANSAGTLQESYSTYMESTTAHINQFKAAFQSLSSTTVDTGFLNWFIDLGTSLLQIFDAAMKAIDAIGGLNTVLSVTVGTIAVVKADSIVVLFRNLTKFTRVLPEVIAGLSLVKEGFSMAFSASRAQNVNSITSAVNGLRGGFSALTSIMSKAQLVMGGIAAALAAIAAVAWVIDKIVVTAEEADEAMEESFSEFEEAASKVESLNGELETTQARIRELEAKDSLTFVEQSELEKLRETNKLLQIQADLAEKERAREAKEAADDTVTAYRKNFSHDITAGAVKDNISYSNSTGNNAILASDETDISAMLAYVEQMKKLRDEVDTTSEDYLHYQGLIDDTTDSIWAQTTVLQGYADKLEAIPYDNLTEGQKTVLNEINDAIALIYNTLDPAKWKDIQFNGLADGVKDELNRMSADGEMTAGQVERLSERFPELDAAMERTGMTAGDVADYFNGLAAAQDNGGTSAEDYTAKLSDLSETISGMKSAYDLLETAQEEMNTAGGLSADTIAKLASSCDNYMDFLYEENGLIKLNTEAWRENAEAKIKSDMDAIQHEISSLESQNALLEQEKTGLSVRSGNTGVQRKISEINDAIRANDAVIEENQRLYNKYESIYKSVTNAASGWVSTLAAFDGASSSLEQLASIQAELADGYTVTAAKAREFAAVYPEILNEATVSADGQITLNEAVVNSFLQGKEAEIRGAAQAEAEKLKAKQALLQAELTVVEEQIAAAESGDDAIVKSANESAQARMTLEQAVLSACEQAGIDETTANQLALAAMTGDWDTFKSLATQAVNDLDRDSAIAFNSVMTNFAITSQNMVDNTNQVIGAFNQMGKALQNAMKGVETDLYSGIASAGSVSGTGNETVKGLLSEMFEEGKSGYSSSEGGAYDGAVEEWKNRLQEIIDSYASTEPDLSGLYKQRDSLNKQITDIQNQIGLLDSLGNTPLDKFNSDTGKSSGSSGGSQKASDAADTIIDKVGAAEDNVNLLSKALGELRDNGRASIDTVSSLDKAMGSLSGFNKAVTALTRDGATMEEAQLACNELAEEMLDTSGILDMVTEENAEMIAGMLESIGVVNAHELVWRKLGSTALKAKVAQAGLADAAWEDVEAYLASTDATQGEINALQTLRAEQYNAALAAVDFTKANAGVTDELIRQAKAAGASSDALAALRKLQTYQTMGYAGAKANGFQGTEEAFNHFLNTLAEQARIDLSDVEIAAPDVEVNVTVEGEESSTLRMSDGTSTLDQQKQLAKDMGFEAPTMAIEEDLENYVVEIEKFRDAIHELTEAIKDQTRTQYDLDMTDDLREKIELERKLIQDTKSVQADRHALNTERRAELDKRIAALEELGFDIDHDLTNNKLYVKNLDMINELSLPEINHILSATGGQPITNESIARIEEANRQIEELEAKLEDLEAKKQEFLNQFGDSNGNIEEGNTAYVPFTELLNEINSTEYRLLGSKNAISWNEGTSEYVKAENTLREFIEKTIDDMNEFNDANQENSEAWLDDAKTIREAQKSIIDLLGEIVSESSKSVDTIQDVYSTLKEGAQEFSESGGYLSIDTYQKILDLGPQYMQYLVDENGQWVINEERIKAVTAAKAEQLALDNAWAYVERLKIALQEDSIEDLDELLYATTKTAEGTWDLVYANLAMLNLNGGQYDAALHNIQVMRDLAYSAIDGIGILSDTTSDSIGSMREGLDDILHYVMEMLKQRVQDQIDALGDMKDAYGELIDEKKKSLDATKTEESYEKKRAKQLKEIAKLQARLDMLSLDNSREAQAERTKLLEQMADLQENLSDTQSDYAIDNQKDALDKMKDAYNEEKDAEIKKLEDSVSSQQKVYEMAIDYIQSYWGDRWDELKAELLQWNYDVGSDLEENLVSAWENATAAAQKYGDFVSAMEAVKVTESSGDYGNVVANRTEHGGNSEVNSYMAEKVGEMKRNSADWMKLNQSNDPNKSDKMRAKDARNAEIAADLSAKYGSLLGGSLWRGSDGVWYLPDGRRLYDTSMFVYHKGGTVGNTGTLRDDEVLAKLQTGETVLTRKMWENAVELVGRMTEMTEAMSGVGTRNDWLNGSILRNMDNIRPNAVTNITNDTRPVEITFGDTIINGAAPDTVEKHREISREMMNEIARRIRKP